MEKIAWDGTKWGQEDLLPANPDLADLLGRTDLDSSIFIFDMFLIPNFWIFRSQISKIWPLAGLGPGLSHLDLLEHSSAVAPGWLRGGSAALPDHKVREIQGTRTIL